jgi:NAD(P)-dependent dehydrogenase (short-subunit alcohol dehydrogenase family)
VAPEEIERRLTANVTIGRLVDMAEVADVVAFLASPRSIAINGDAIACGGGAAEAIHY